MIWLFTALALAADIRGMTVSTPTWGWEWGTDTMAETLSELDKDGVNWVSIHPYASIRNDGAVRFREIDPDNPPEWLVRPIREAHARGMKILIKPHLAYWGSKFSWRGEITFTSAEERERFHQTYRDWVYTLAKLVPEADAFCIGTELEGMLDDAAWRATIARVRTVYPRPDHLCGQLGPGARRAILGGGGRHRGPGVFSARERRNASYRGRARPGVGPNHGGPTGAWPAARQAHRVHRARVRRVGQCGHGAVEGCVEPRCGGAAGSVHSSRVSGDRQRTHGDRRVFVEVVSG